jgi:hypothetical protein
MKLTGVTIETIAGTLHERSDGLYQDDFGKKFDYRGGKLFEEREPGKWYWLRQVPRTFSNHVEQGSPKIVGADGKEMEF